MDCILYGLALIVVGFVGGLPVGRHYGFKNGYDHGVVTGRYEQKQMQSAIASICGNESHEGESDEVA